MLQKVQEYNKGCFIGEEIKVNCIMYADDTLLLAPNAKNLKEMVKIVESYCYEWQIKLNVKKSAYIVVGNYYHRRENSKIIMDGQELSKSKEMKYLGITINELFTDATHLANKRLSMSRSIYSMFPIGIQGSNMSNDIKSHLIKTYCRPILYYGIENLSINKTELKKIHSCEGILIKKAFGLPKTMHHTSIMNSYGYDPSNIAIAKRKLNFYVQLMKNNLTASIIEKRGQEDDSNMMFNRGIVSETKRILRNQYLIESDEEVDNEPISQENILEKIKRKLNSIKNKLMEERRGGLCDTIRFLMSTNNKEMLNTMLNPVKRLISTQTI